MGGHFQGIIIRCPNIVHIGLAIMKRSRVWLSLLKMALRPTEANVTVQMRVEPIAVGKVGVRNTAHSAVTCSGPGPRTVISHHAPGLNGAISIRVIPQNLMFKLNCSVARSGSRVFIIIKSDQITRHWLRRRDIVGSVAPYGNSEIKVKSVVCRGIRERCDIRLLKRYDIRICGRV